MAEMLNYCFCMLSCFCIVFTSIQLKYFIKTCDHSMAYMSYTVYVRQELWGWAGWGGEGEMYKLDSQLSALSVTSSLHSVSQVLSFFLHRKGLFIKVKTHKHLETFFLFLMTPNTCSLAN